jgi:hypothetical protein
MQQADQNNEMLEEAKKRVQESRKKAIRFNTLLSLFVCLVIIGLAGAIYYYNKINDLYEQKEILNKNLANAADSIKKLNTVLEGFAIDYKQSINTGNTTGVADTVLKKLKSVVNVITTKNLDTTKSRNRDTARKYSEIGYDRLKAYDFAGAKSAFDKSEKAFNGYRESYEIYYLLYKNMNMLHDAATQKRVMQKILTEYNSKNILKISDIR